MNVVLIGFMGSGKTTFGKQLAQRSGFAFLDMDAEIEASAGMPIVDIFTTKGESVFRQLEHSFLLSLAEKQQVVLSTGGGIVLREDNMKQLNQFGLIVFLSPSPDELLRRLKGDTTRPVIAGKSPKEILALYQSRLPYYQKYADMTLDGSDCSMRQLLQIIKEQRTSKSPCQTGKEPDPCN